MYNLYVINPHFSRRQLYGMLPGNARDSNGSQMSNVTMVEEGVFFNFIKALFIFNKYSRMERNHQFSFIHLLPWNTVCSI